MEHAVALHHDHLVLGRFRPLRPLGSGGSGSVWLVRDERSARDVALKVVPREGKAGSRAEREVEAAARLRHPRCLRALALERDEHHVYVAYEYIPGKTLRQCLRSGELDDAASVEVGAQVLDALAHAHGKRVLHRDVKPGNVMVEERDPLSVRLLDFGLAQLEEAETLTAAGDVPGTLAYIAPERLAGAEAGGAADVWSVGVLLWEALAGRHPFSSFSPLETARRVQEGAPPLASQRPDLPRALTATVDRMLEADPARRPGAREAAARLRTAWSEVGERPRAVTSRATLSERALHAGLAALLAGGTTWLLPFFPAAWPFLLAALCALAALWSPVAGLALALSVPVLPLGNASLGLALAYSALAVLWLALFRREPRSGLLFLAGAVLGGLQGLALFPALVLGVRGLAHRIALSAAAAATAAAVAGIRDDASLGLQGTSSPLGALDVLSAYVRARPELWVVGVVLAAATATAPLARSRGLWGIALWGAAYVAAALLAPASAAGAFPLVLWIWLAAALLARPVLRAR
ncbi:MAG TPA: serine/threonine-protein kinase [Gaiellaceae bacterium]|nr:serine/threonine-protein kinase [Gaiellaceae bacterium]